MTHARERPPRASPHPRPVASAAGFQIAIALLLAAACGSALRDTDAAAGQLGLSALLPTTVASFVLVALASIGLGLVVLLVVPLTRDVAAWFVSALLTVSAIGLLVAWADGRPARCLCLSGATHHSALAHLSTFAAVAAVAVVSWGAAAARPTLRAPKAGGNPTS